MRMTQRVLLGAGIASALGLGLVVGTRTLRSADHIDAPITAGDAPVDINDLFVFTSPTDPSRVVFGLTMNPLIAPADAPATRFPTDVLYQFKIDTDANSVEDLVLQAKIVDDGDGQLLVVRGPGVPDLTGTMAMELQTDAVASGRVSGVNETFIIEGDGGVRAFAGVRDDPFYIDLTRLLDVLAGNATSFRTPGVDALAGLNTLAIIIELPKSVLGGATDIGVWATSNRATN